MIQDAFKRHMMRDKFKKFMLMIKKVAKIVK